MRKKKLAKTRRDYTNEWLAVTPQEHLIQAAEVVGAVLAEGDAAPVRGTNLAHAQTHLLAGLLKTQLQKGDVGIPID
jgi:hypothetical protein